MGTPTRRRIGVLSTILGLAAAGIGLTSAPAAADFQGECTPTDASSGVCVVDEINGNDPALHGTATYSIEGDTLVLEFDGVSNVTEVQACVTVDDGGANPYLPVGDSGNNPCAGNTPDRIYSGGFVSPLELDLTDVPDWDPGESVFFAVHLVQGGLTTYVIGGGEPGCVDDPATNEDECNPCVDDPATAEDECNPCVDDPATSEDECNPCVDDPATAEDECNPCVDDPATAEDECNPCPTEGVSAAETDPDPCNPCPTDGVSAAETDPCNPCPDGVSAANNDPDPCNPCVDDPATAEDECNPCVDDPATAEDECNPCVDDPATAEDECNPCVDDPATAEDECNPCVDDKATAEDECNPCVDDPATAADECNPCVDDPATAANECVPPLGGPTSPPAGPPSDPPAVRPLSTVRPTEVLGTTQTRPSALPATGTDTVGPLFLAFGLAFLGAGLVLLAEGSTRKLLRRASARRPGPARRRRPDRRHRFTTAWERRQRPGGSQRPGRRLALTRDLTPLVSVVAGARLRYWW